MNNINLPTTGQRIRRFRKERGYSQQQLELEANLSFGCASRFESGETNPTKETLNHISHVLTLSDREQEYLLGLIVGQAPAEEVAAARQYSQPYLTNCPNPIHISDDTWRLNDWNKPMLRLIGVSEDFANKFRSICTLDILFHPDLPIHQNIPPEFWPEIADYQVTQFQREVGLWCDEQWYSDLLNRLHTYPDFTKYWEKALRKDKNKLPDQERIFAIKGTNDTIKRYRVIDKRIDRHPRINLIEWMPI